MISNSCQAGHVVWARVNLTVLVLWRSAIPLHRRTTYGKLIQFQQWHPIEFYLLQEKLTVLLLTGWAGTWRKSGPGWTAWQ